jgi:hypothetical protein
MGKTWRSRPGLANARKTGEDPGAAGGPHPKGGLGVADDDDREERDEDEEEEDEAEEEVKKPAPKAQAKPVKSAASSAPASGGDVQSELKKIRVLLEEGRDQQKQYLWLLFPIIAILLVQAILTATKM